MEGEDPRDHGIQGGRGAVGNGPTGREQSFSLDQCRSIRKKVCSSITEVT